MLPELESRVTRLVQQFREYELTLAKINADLWSSPTLTGRQKVAARGATQIALGALRTRSQTSLPPLLKLAYVRGARQGRPNYRLTPEALASLHTTTADTYRFLDLQARYGINRVAKVIRLRELSGYAAAAAKNPTQSAAPALDATLKVLKPIPPVWGLEQRAYVLLHNVTERAFHLGEVAVGYAPTYDLT